MSWIVRTRTPLHFSEVLARCAHIGNFSEIPERCARRQANFSEISAHCARRHILNQILRNPCLGQRPAAAAAAPPLTDTAPQAPDQGVHACVQEEVQPAPARAALLQKVQGALQARGRRATSTQSHARGLNDSQICAVSVIRYFLHVYNRNAPRSRGFTHLEDRALSTWRECCPEVVRWHKSSSCAPRASTRARRVAACAHPWPTRPATGTEQKKISILKVGQAMECAMITPTVVSAPSQQAP